MTETEARILDATAGNRTIYKTKSDPRILYIDIEPDLSIKPDLLLDCTDTKFSDGSFHTIIFDPPHEYGRKKNAGWMTTPNKANAKPEWTEKCWAPMKLPAYYGADKYKTARELMVFIRRAAIEFSRILTSDGIVLLKWGENFKGVDNIIFWFQEAGFFELMRTSRRSGKGHGGVWVFLMKKIHRNEGA